MLPFFWQLLKLQIILAQSLFVHFIYHYLGKRLHYWVNHGLMTDTIPLKCIKKSTKEVFL